MLASVLIATGISIFVSGCAGSIGAKPEELVKRNYSVHMPAEVVVLSEPSYNIDRGKIVVSNGNDILDEEGDVIFAKEINGKLFYVVNASGNYKLKNESKETIKEFPGYSKKQIFASDGKIYLAFADKKDSQFYRNVYTNFYSFDGNTVNLIDKRKIISGTAVGDADLVVSRKTPDSSYSYYIYHIIKSKDKIKPSLLPVGGYSSLLGGKIGYHYDYVPGAVGDVVVYQYRYKFDDNGNVVSKRILEAHNTVTGEVAILSDNQEEKFQFLTNGQDVVFKSGDRTVDIRTLKKAKIDANFKPIVFRDGYTNMGGGTNRTDKESYTMTDFNTRKDTVSQKFMFLKD
jgi:hypothetical protein